MNSPTTKLRAILGGVGLALLAGCASTPQPRYFVLEAPAAAPAAIAPYSSSTVMVGPITVSDHLKRRGIASRETQGRIIISQYDRWVGSLDQNIAGVVTEILQQKRGSNNAINYYSNFSADHDNAVKIHISKFDRIPGNQVTLVASWQVRNIATKEKTVHSGTFSQPITGTSLEGGTQTGDTVAAMNAALAEMAHAVHQSLQK